MKLVHGMLVSLYAGISLPYIDLMWGINLFQHHSIVSVLVHYTMQFITAGCAGAAIAFLIASTTFKSVRSRSHW